MLFVTNKYIKIDFYIFIFFTFYIDFQLKPI